VSVSHCLHNALRIATAPVETWAVQIAALPDACTHADCGVPKNCRKRNHEYLRMQWRVRDRKAELQAESAAKRAGP